MSAERVTPEDLAEVHAVTGAASSGLCYQAIPDGGFAIIAEDPCADDLEALAEDEPQIGWCENEEDARAFVRLVALAPKLAREVERLTAERDALREKAHGLYDAADLLLAEAEGMGGSYGATRDGLRAALAAIREEVKRP